MTDRNGLAAIVAVVLIVLFVVESLVPLRQRTRPVLGRLFINAGVSLLALGAALLLVRPAALESLRWSSGTAVGLAHVVTLPVTAEVVLSCLAMDLTFYWWHLANHRSRFLWRFHNVHHIDPDLDVSTAFRFHFGEVALSAIFRVIQISLIGPSATAFAVYELVFQMNTMFHHSNIRLPIRMERVVNLLLVTPRMHGIHHSQLRDETNSNYSVVFPWWDRLHRTLRLNIPQSQIIIGVPAYSDPTDHTFRNALLLPFRHQRSYWPHAETAPGASNRATLAGSRTQLAE